MLFVFTNMSISQEVKKDTLIMGGHESPPVRIFNNNILSGIHSDILQELLKDTDIELLFKELPSTRSKIMLQNGEIDAYIGMLKTPEREKIYYFCEPPLYEISAKAFYLKKGSGIKIDKYEDLYGLKIGVLRGSLDFKRFNTDEKLIKEYATTNIQNFNKLISGRIDVVIRTENVGDYLVKSKDYSDKIVKADYKYSNYSPSYFVLSRKSKFMEKINIFESNLLRLRENGLITKITNKWQK